MPDAPRTVTLPLVWREDDDMLFVGPIHVGTVFQAGDWHAHWVFEFVRCQRHPTRAAAMAALEEAVCALGVKQDG